MTATPKRGAAVVALSSLPPVTSTGTGAEVGGLAFVRASAVEREEVQWLVPGFIPEAMLADIAADPGVGKSSLVASWAAALTVGRVPLAPDERRPARNVVLLATEDSLGCIVRPRLEAEGADLDRVFLFDTRTDQCGPELPTNIPKLEALVRHTHAAFVGLDPALEFMDPELDSHRQQDVARFTAALASLAQRTGAAVAMVRHFNKAMNLPAIYKAGGSIGFGAKARVHMAAAKDKEHGGRVLAVIKSNVGSDRAAITFDIVERAGSTVVAWGEATTITADELVNQDPKRGGRGRPAKVDSTRTFLEDLLADGKCMVKEDVVAAAKGARAGARTVVFEAAKTMGLVTVTVGGKPGWRLP